MDYRTLVVQAQGDADGTSSIALALGLAVRFDATLVGLAARDLVPIPTLPGASPGVGPLLAAQEANIRASLDAAERQFRALARTTRARISWRSRIADPATSLAEAARTADLIVLGRRPDRDDAHWSRYADPGDVLMATGRPILVVPPGLSALNAEHVVVAWKDSREARRAIADAMPFLTRATSVLVLQICDDSGERERVADTVQDVANYLIGHGVHATGEARVRRESSVADDVLSAVEQRRADLVIAGGYAHARLREWVLGGLTRTLLGHCPKCCLLSH